MDTLPARNKGIIYLIFSLSGFCALIYEVLWTKHLSLTFGTTMIAVSIVAATFMGGLALGSYLLGKFADNETNLLRIYAYLELGIAIFALLFPPTLKVVSLLHATFGQYVVDYPGLNHFAHLGFSAMLLIPPTVCMGGTFPLMCRFFARKKSGGQIGRLYAMNTLGATLGAFLAGYLLIPYFGLPTTNMLAVFINLAIAAISWQFSRTIGSTSTVDVSQATRADQFELAHSHRSVLIAIAMIGFFSMAYEILWTRVFLLFLGNTTYAFSLMLSSFLIGIAIGGAIYARKVHPDFDEKKLFVRLTMLMGLSILITVPFYDYLPHAFQWAHEASGERWWHLSLLSGGIVFCVMCVPTIISGSLLPAAIAILDPGKVRTGEGVGLVVLHNTIGAVLGSLVAGFFLIPTLGTQFSFQMLAVVNILLATTLCLIFAPTPFRRLRHPVTAACVLAPLLVILPPQWDQNLMNSGVYYYAPMITAQGGVDKAMNDYQVIEVLEGIDTTVAIKETQSGKIRFFTVNGKTDGGSGRDIATQLLIGQIPLLLHPNPQDIMVIGLGTGITLGGINAHPVKKIDCVEISPGVAEISKYFTKENRRALEDPRVTLTIDDGRNTLLTHSQQYDIIVSEPSNPWQSGNANLFTDEFYKLAASRLKKDGILCQWLPLYDLNPESLRIAAHTFLETFPNVLVFKIDSDMVMIGTQGKVKVDYGQIQERLKRPASRTVLAQAGIFTPADLIARHYLFAEDSLHNFAGEATLNTDNRPILEFSYQHNLGPNAFSNNLKENLDEIHQASLGESLPLLNLGDTRKEIAGTFNELGESCSKAGRMQEAEYFLAQAEKIQRK
jgi:spermidine synthase